MTRMTFLSSAAVLALGFAVGSPAAAQTTMQPDVMAPDPDPAAQLMTDCDVPSLEDDAVDACLERARALQETNPSDDVEQLEVRLEQRSVQRFDPNSVAPPTTQAKAAAVKLDSPDNVTTPPAKMLEPDATNSADARPTVDATGMVNRDNAAQPILGDAKIDDGNPPDDTVEDPPPPETPALDDDPPAKVADPPH